MSISEEEARLFHRYICEGVGDPKRLRLLYLLSERPYSVSELVTVLETSQPTVSHHLRILRDRGMVTARKEGTTVYYTLSDPRILQALETMRSFLAEMLSIGASVARGGEGL
jgi:ArsR family transcriptional regulator